MGVIKQYRLGKLGGPGAQMNPGGVEQPAAKAEPASRVMISADRHYARARFTQPDQAVLAQGESVGRRHRAIIYVTSDQHRVDALRPDGRDQMVKESALSVQQTDPVQGAAKMPVGGVQEPHRPAHYRKPLTVRP